MKKRLLGMALAASLMLSLTGCGERTDESGDDSITQDILSSMHGTTSQTGYDNDSVIDSGVSVPELGGGDVADSEVQEEAMPKAQRILGKGKLHSNYWCFSVEGTDYLYNIMEGTLRESSWINPENVSGTTYYDIKTKQLIDLTTGEVLCQLDEDTILIPCRAQSCDMHSLAVNTQSSYFNNGMALAFKIEKSFSGDTYYMGYLNSVGEWVLPLTTDFSVLKCDESDVIKEQLSKMYGDPSENDIFLSYFDGMYGLRYTDYFFNENEAYTIDIDYEKSTDHLNTVACKYSDGVIYGYIYPNGCDPTDLFKYDCKMQQYEVTPLSSVGISKDINRVQISYYDDYIGIYYHEEYGPSKLNYNYIKLDYDFNVIEKYDISQCKDIEGLVVSEKSVGFLGVNQSDDPYICLMKPDGSFAFDPIKTESSSVYYEGITMDNNSDMFICYHNKVDKTYVYSYETEQLTIFDGSTGRSVVNHDPTSGMLVIHDKNAFDGLGSYYLADAADPDTLIDPFGEQ